jgi:phosphoribosylformylglycinamidine synthase
MKFGVLVFPGSNCDDDAIHVFGDVLEQEVVKVWHKEKNLPDVDCVIVPGGFSYGDYLRCGAIARFSPVMQSVIEFANAGGYVYGICNGFQILCEAHLLPGVLLRNANQKFICKNVYLKPMTHQSALTADLDLSRPLKIPIAHAEGRYYADESTLADLVANDQILFKYCDENGHFTEGSNPNGSMLDIVGICNTQRNVFGMMPHPERASETALGNTDGLLMLRSLVNHYEV